MYYSIFWKSLALDLLGRLRSFWFLFFRVSIQKIENEILTILTLAPHPRVRPFRIPFRRDPSKFVWFFRRIESHDRLVLTPLNLGNDFEFKILNSSRVRFLIRELTTDDRLIQNQFRDFFRINLRPNIIWSFTCKSAQREDQSSPRTRCSSWKSRIALYP